MPAILSESDVAALHAATAAKNEAAARLADATKAEGDLFRHMAPKTEPGVVTRNHLSGTTVYVRVGDDLLETTLYEPTKGE